MGGHGHGHEPPYRIPDHTMFQTKGIQPLEELERALAARGLRDPWIRNEAWRYHPGFGTKLARARKLFFRGFGLGLALTALTLGLDRLSGAGDQHDQQHGHGAH